MEEPLFEFKSTERSRKSFGKSIICQDLINIMYDWAQGEREVLANMNFNDGTAEPSKAQGRIELATYFATFLETFKEIEIEGDSNDS